MLPRFRSHSLRPRSHDIAARASSFAAASPRDAAMSKRPPPSPTGSFDNASERDAADSGEEQDNRDTPGGSLECPGVSLERRKGVGCSEVHLVSLTNQTLDVWISFGDVLSERLKVDASQQLATTKCLVQLFEILNGRPLFNDEARGLRRGLLFQLYLTKGELFVHHKALIEAHMEKTRFWKIKGGGVDGEPWTADITDRTNWTEVLDVAHKSLLKRDSKVLCAVCSDIEKLISEAASDMEVFSNINMEMYKDDTYQVRWLSSAKEALATGWATFHTAMFLESLKTHATDPAKLKSALQSEEKAMIFHKCAMHIPAIIWLKVRHGIGMTHSD